MQDPELNPGPQEVCLEKATTIALLLLPVFITTICYSIILGVRNEVCIGENSALLMRMINV